MNISMEKSGKILEKCNADLENADNYHTVDYQCIWFTYRWTKCLEKSGKRSNSVVEKSGKPQISVQTLVAQKVDAAFPSLASTSWSVPVPVVLIVLCKSVNYSTLSVGQFANITVCGLNGFTFIALVLSLLIFNPTKAATSSKHGVFSCIWL